MLCGLGNGILVSNLHVTINMCVWYNVCGLTVEDRETLRNGGNYTRVQQ